jgi:hypothetical protein
MSSSCSSCPRTPWRAPPLCWTRSQKRAKCSWNSRRPRRRRRRGRRQRRRRPPPPAAASAAPHARARHSAHRRRRRRRRRLRRPCLWFFGHSSSGGDRTAVLIALVVRLALCSVNARHGARPPQRSGYLRSTELGRCAPLRGGTLCRLHRIPRRLLGLCRLLARSPSHAPERDPEHHGHGQTDRDSADDLVQ